MTDQNINVFEGASLLQFQTSTWAATKMLNEEEIRRFADPNWVKGRKHLVDPEFLSPPKRTISRTRQYLKTMALPFPIPGLAMVAKDTITRIDSFLTEKREDFFRGVDKIVAEYPTAREVAQAYLEPSGHFNEHDYPEHIAFLYSFNWRYLEISVPAKLRQMAPEIYQRQIADFEAMMTEAKELAVATLYEEVSGLIEKMVERLGTEDDGKPRKFKDSLVGNFVEFFETFKDRNLFPSAKLDEIVDRAKIVLSGVTADGLRQFPEFRQKVRSEMEGVKALVDEAVVDLPRRKFKLDPEQLDKAA